MAKKKGKKLIRMTANELIDALIDAVRKGRDELQINEIANHILLATIPKEELQKDDWAPGPISDPFRGIANEKLIARAKELVEAPGSEKSIDIITKISAELLVRDFTKELTTNPKFLGMSDDEKMAEMKARHPEFTSKYPIVSQYLVLDKKFHHTAFHNFLNKTREFYTDAKKRNIEKKKAWCMLQAYYVKYLVCEYDKSISAAEAGKIYEDAKDKMIKDYEDFDKEYEKHIEEIKQLESANKKSMLDQIIANAESLSEDQIDKLLHAAEAEENKQKLSLEVFPQIATLFRREKENSIEGKGKNALSLDFQAEKVVKSTS